MKNKNSQISSNKDRITKKINEINIKISLSAQNKISIIINIRETDEFIFLSNQFDYFFEKIIENQIRENVEKINKKNHSLTFKTMFKKIIKKLTNFLFKEKSTKTLISTQRKITKKYTTFLIRSKSKRFTKIIFSESFITFTTKNVIIKSAQKIINIIEEEL